MSCTYVCNVCGGAGYLALITHTEGGFATNVSTFDVDALKRFFDPCVTIEPGDICGLCDGKGSVSTNCMQTSGYCEHKEALLSLPVKEPFDKTAIADFSL